MPLSQSACCASARARGVRAKSYQSSSSAAAVAAISSMKQRWSQTLPRTRLSADCAHEVVCTRHIR